MSKSIAIIGGGGLGREIRSLLAREHSFAGFFDDKRLDDDYLGSISEIPEQYDKNLVIGIGDPVIKKELFNQISSKSLQFANIISENTVFNTSCLAGTGSIICDGVIATVNYKIGSHLLINLNVTIGHDVEIGDFSSIMPGVNISGGVKIGEATLIGSGATILQGIKIGSNVRIGAGAVVTKDVPDNVTLVGVPAKIVN